jgi:hypothetical protein
MNKLICIALFLLPTFAAAQQAFEPRFEVTPFVGYMRGGSVRIDDTQLTRGGVDVKVEQSAAWGVKVEQTMSWGPDLRLQYLFQRAQSQLEDNRKLFGEEPSGPVPPGSFSFTDMSVNYVHVGLMKYMGKGTTTPYELRPFIAGGLGVAQSKFHEIPLDDQIRPSVSFGIGFQWPMTERLALRFETRGFYTHFTGADVTVPVTNRDCVVLLDNPCLRTYSYPNSFIQGDITAGVSWKF